MKSTVIVQITSNISRAHLDTQLLIDQSHVDWQQSGLIKPSVVICTNLATVNQSHIKRFIGSLSEETMQEIEKCLKVVLDL